MANLTEPWERERFGPAVEAVAAQEAARPMTQASWRQAERPLRGLREDQEEFLEWLVDPNPNKGTQADWARAHGKTGKDVSTWKKSKAFKAAWEKRLAELNVEPDRIQNVINAIYRSATNGDVKAASLYLQYVDRFTPKTRQVIEDNRVEELSDEELADELEATVLQLRRDRSA